MTDELTQAAMTMWAAKDLPARLLAAQVAKLLNCTPEDVAVLVSAGKLRPLGRPNPNAVKFFSAVELIALLADRDVAGRCDENDWAILEAQECPTQGLDRRNTGGDRENSIVPNQSTSSGLFTPSPGLCITCVYICVVVTLLWPSKDCKVRMSTPDSSM